jgi:hypothetical protein
MLRINGLRGPDKSAGLAQSAIIRTKLPPGLKFAELLLPDQRGPT